MYQWNPSKAGNLEPHIFSIIKCYHKTRMKVILNVNRESLLSRVQEWIWNMITIRRLSCSVMECMYKNWLSITILDPLSRGSTSGSANNTSLSVHNFSGMNTKFNHNDMTIMLHYEIYVHTDSTLLYWTLVVVGAHEGLQMTLVCLFTSFQE